MKDKSLYCLALLAKTLPQLHQKNYVDENARQKPSLKIRTPSMHGIPLGHGTKSSFSMTLQNLKYPPKSNSLNLLILCQSTSGPNYVPWATNSSLARLFFKAALYENFHRIEKALSQPVRQRWFWQKSPRQYGHILMSYTPSHRAAAGNFSIQVQKKWLRLLDDQENRRCPELWYFGGFRTRSTNGTCPDTVTLLCIPERRTIVTRTF